MACSGERSVDFFLGEVLGAQKGDALFDGRRCDRGILEDWGRSGVRMEGEEEEEEVVVVVVKVVVKVMVEVVVVVVEVVMRSAYLQEMAPSTRSSRTILAGRQSLGREGKTMMLQQETVVPSLHTRRYLLLSLSRDVGGERGLGLLNRHGSSPVPRA